jgi:tRNA dimethylallyltransferase
LVQKTEESDNFENILILIVGPTAVGKTDLTISLAKKLKCDIISCDSRQFYKEMNIGTAKPSFSEMKEVKHHFINSHSVSDYYSAGDFERDVETFLETYFKKNKIVIMTGGSGLFIKSITDGLDTMPEAPLELRNSLMARLATEGITILQNELLKLDAETYQTMDVSNSQRVIRALEVCLSTGKPFSFFQKNIEKKHKYKIIKIGLERTRSELYERINRRVDAMIEEGLVKEVANLKIFESQNALQTVGYKEVFSFLRDEINFEKMVELIKRNTRRYAKRQITWFKNQDTFQWFNPEEEDLVLDYINNEKVKYS